MRTRKPTATRSDIVIGVVAASPEGAALVARLAALYPHHGIVDARAV